MMDIEAVAWVTLALLLSLIAAGILLVGLGALMVIAGTAMEAIEGIGSRLVDQYKAWRRP